MASPPLLCVVDSNVLIDLDCGGVLNRLSLLPQTSVSPDVIFAELEQPDSAGLSAAGLRSLELEGALVARVAHLRQQHRHVSTNDLFALVLAQELARGQGCILLTGDGALARLASQSGVVVHGTLWLLDEMVRRVALTPSAAADALERMLAARRRLPLAECRKRMEVWRG